MLVRECNKPKTKNANQDERSLNFVSSKSDETIRSAGNFWFVVATVMVVSVGREVLVSLAVWPTRNLRFSLSRWMTTRSEMTVWCDDDD